MHPVRLVLAVEDPDYAEAILRYIQGSDFAVRLQAAAFTRTEALIQHLNSGVSVDAVAGDVRMIEALLASVSRPVSWVALMEGGEELPDGDGMGIPKYQPLPQLLDVCIGHAKARTSRALSSFTGEHSLVMACASAMGGCGKTTVSLNMARQLSGLGQRVFYLNLETLNSAGLFMPRPAAGGSLSFSRLLYDLKALRDHGERPELEKYIVRNETLRSDMFDPSAQVKELLQLPADDIRELILMVAKSGRYDVVIIDMDFNLEAKLYAVMDFSDAVVWLLLDDLAAMHKSKAFFHHMEKENPQGFGSLLKKAHFVVNRYTGSLRNALPLSDMTPEGFLPYIPSWKQADQADLLLCSPVFQREVLKLLRHLLGNTDEQVPAASGGGVFAG